MPEAPQRQPKAQPQTGAAQSATAPPVPQWQYVNFQGQPPQFAYYPGYPGPMPQYYQAAPPVPRTGH
jgi:hypothetical protein